MSLHRRATMCETGVTRLSRKSLALCLLPLACAAVSGCGGSAVARTGATGGVLGATHSAQDPVCAQDPHAGVHEPQRLKVLNPCATFVGTVSRATRLNPSDGDVTLNAKPDPGYESMLNAKNLQEGGLHIEIVPRDQPGCTTGQPIQGNVDNLGTCSGANVLYPPLGAHIRVIGPWVLDAWVGWNEIHPAWRVEVIPPAGPPPPERHVFSARLTGGRSPARTARATLTLSGTRLCWSFTRLSHVGKPTRAAVIRSKPGVRMPLGRAYSAKGCKTIVRSHAESLTTAPRSFSVVLYTRQYPRGATRARLAPASD